MNDDMHMALLMVAQRPMAVLKLVLGFVLKMAVFWPWLARDLFFSQSLEQSALKRQEKHPVFFLNLLLCEQNAVS